MKFALLSLLILILAFVGGYLVAVNVYVDHQGALWFACAVTSGVAVVVALVAACYYADN